MDDQAVTEPGDAGTRRRAALFAWYVAPDVPVLFRVALTLTRQQADAEDLVQDTLVRAYRAVDGFDGNHPRAWLLTILRNTHRNRLRLRLPALSRDHEQESERFERRDAARSAEDIVIDAQFEAVVTDALTALPTIQRVVVQLVDVDGLTYTEAALALDIPRGTVMSRLHRARSRIRTRLLAAGLIPRSRL